jgi:hypothetical protein
MAKSLEKREEHAAFLSGRRGASVANLFFPKTSDSHGYP